VDQIEVEIIEAETLKGELERASRGLLARVLDP